MGGLKGEESFEGRLLRPALVSSRMGVSVLELGRMNFEWLTLCREGTVTPLCDASVSFAFSTVIGSTWMLPLILLAESVLQRA